MKRANSGDKPSETDSKKHFKRQRFDRARYWRYSFLALLPFLLQVLLPLRGYLILNLALAVGFIIILQPAENRLNDRNLSRSWLIVPIFLFSFLGWFMNGILGAVILPIKAITAATVPFFSLGFLILVGAGLYDAILSGNVVELSRFFSGIINQSHTLNDSATGAGVMRVAACLSVLYILWMNVQLYFLRGTRGSNRYGADPLEAGAPSEDDING